MKNENMESWELSLRENLSNPPSSSASEVDASWNRLVPKLDDDDKKKPFAWLKFISVVVIAIGVNLLIGNTRQNSNVKLDKKLAGSKGKTSVSNGRITNFNTKPVSKQMDIAQSESKMKSNTSIPSSEQVKEPQLVSHSRGYIEKIAKNRSSKSVSKTVQFQKVSNNGAISTTQKSRTSNKTNNSSQSNLYNQKNDVAKLEQNMIHSGALARNEAQQMGHQTSLIQASSKDKLPSDENTNFVENSSNVNYPIVLEQSQNELGDKKIELIQKGEDIIKVTTQQFNKKDSEILSIVSMKVVETKVESENSNVLTSMPILAENKTTENKTINQFLNTDTKHDLLINKGQMKPWKLYFTFNHGVGLKAASPIQATLMGLKFNYKINSLWSLMSGLNFQQVYINALITEKSNVVTQYTEDLTTPLNARVFQVQGVKNNIELAYSKGQLLSIPFVINYAFHNHWSVGLGGNYFNILSSRTSVYTSSTGYIETQIIDKSQDASLAPTSVVSTYNKSQFYQVSGLQGLFNLNYNISDKYIFTIGYVQPLSKTFKSTFSSQLNSYFKNPQVNIGASVLLFNSKTR